MQRCWRTLLRKMKRLNHSQAAKSEVWVCAPWIIHVQARLQLYYHPVHVCAAGLCVWSRQFVYMCICDQKTAVWGFTASKSPISVSTVRSSSITAKKGAHYTRRFVQGKKFRSILLMGWEKGSVKLYYSKPCLVYSYTMLANTERQHATAVQTSLQVVCSWVCSLHQQTRSTCTNTSEAHLSLHSSQFKKHMHFNSSQFKKHMH